MSEEPEPLIPLRGEALTRLADACTRILQPHMNGTATMSDERLVELAEFIWAQRRRGITDQKCVEAVHSNTNPMNGRRW